MPGEAAIAQAIPYMQQQIMGKVQAGIGLINAAKSKKEAKELAKTRPKYKKSVLAGEDLDLAESELASGNLSSRAETAYNNLNNQQFASSLSAILKGGGSVNNVADVYGENEEGRTRLALLSDQARLAKIQNLMRTRQMYRDEEDKEFQINEYAPWKDAQMANAEARKGAEEMIWSGLGTAGAGSMNAAGTAANQAGYNNFFRQPTQPSVPTPGLSGAANFNFNPQQFRPQYGPQGMYGDNFNYDLYNQIGEGMF